MMPYESKAQERFFRACEHGFNPKHKGVKCPPRKVTKEFATAEALKRRGRRYA